MSRYEKERKVRTLDDRRSYERPMEFPTGIDWVLVNGVVVIAKGKHTGAKPGKVLWGPVTSPRKTWAGRNWSD